MVNIHSYIDRNNNNNNTNNNNNNSSNNVYTSRCVRVLAQGLCKYYLHRSDFNGRSPKGIHRIRSVLHARGEPAEG